MISFLRSLLTCLFCFLTPTLLMGLPPVITQLTPPSGLIAGGTLVTITGSGFTTTTDVQFGGLPATSFIINSDTSITAISPRHSPQVNAVTVTNLDGTSNPLDHNSFFVFQGDAFAYVCNGSSNTISVLNTTAGLPFVITTIPLDASPQLTAFIPDGTKAYIAPGSGTDIFVIDTATHTVVDTIPIGVFTPNSIQASPDGTKVYATQNPSNLLIIDPATDTVSSLAVGVSPFSSSFTPDSSKAFVPNSGSNTTSVIDVPQDVVQATIPSPGFQAQASAVTPDGTKAYINKATGDQVTVLRVSDNTILATIPVGDVPAAIAITPDGTKALVVNQSSPSVTIIDTQTDTIISTLGVQFNSTGISITPDSTKAYVNHFSPFATRINLVNNTSLLIPMPSNSNDPIAITANGQKALVTNEDSNTVTAINTQTDLIINSVPVGTVPLTVTCFPDQAPLAKFTVTPLSPNEFQFDASQSLSPVGTIVNYLWDFGDGSIVSTALSTITHTYAIPGIKTVTLTVTNSEGTSTAQIFYSSTNACFSIINNLSFNQETALRNNGGPTATLNQQINVSFSLPPRNFKACKKVSQCSKRLYFRWKAPIQGEPPVSYRIYRDALLTDLVAEVDGSKTKFVLHSSNLQLQQSYFIVAVHAQGSESTPLEAVVKFCCK